MDGFNIIEAIMSAVAFDRLNLHFKKERDYKFWRVEYYRTIKREEISNYYQLPFKFFDWKFYNQLVEKESLSFDEIKAFVKLLKQRNKIYLTKETKRDLKFIKNAIELKWDFEQLRKRLSFDLSAENAPYYWFVYYEILPIGRITPQDFLENIRLAEKTNIMANMTTHIKFVDTIHEHLMDKSRADPSLIDYHDTMDHLYAFIVYRTFEKYEKLVRLNNVFS